MKRIHLTALPILALATAFATTGCRPEIAETLDDYCNYQKNCDYKTANTQTQFHDYSSCDKFHKDLLDKASSGKISGCKEYVTDFFIEFMKAQMDYGCDATLEQTLSSSEETQVELSGMLACVKEKSDESGNLAYAQDMGLSVLESLEINIGQLSTESCQILIKSFGFGVKEDGSDISEGICLLAKELDVESCSAMLPLVVPDAALAQRICNLYQYE